jgi:hypothetical protein
MNESPQKLIRDGRRISGSATSSSAGTSPVVANFVNMPRPNGSMPTNGAHEEAVRFFAFAPLWVADAAVADVVANRHRAPAGTRLGTPRLRPERAIRCAAAGR